MGATLAVSTESTESTSIQKASCTQSRSVPGEFKSATCKSPNSPLPRILPKAGDTGSGGNSFENGKLSKAPGISKRSIDSKCVKRTFKTLGGDLKANLEDVREEATKDTITQDFNTTTDASDKTGKAAYKKVFNKLFDEKIGKINTKATETVKSGGQAILNGAEKAVDWAGASITAAKKRCSEIFTTVKKAFSEIPWHEAKVVSTAAARFVKAKIYLGRKIAEGALKGAGKEGFIRGGKDAAFEVSYERAMERIDAWQRQKGQSKMR